MYRYTDEKITQIKFNKPPQEIHIDFRPISLTNSVATILEGFNNRRLLPQVGEYSDPKQYALLTYGNMPVQPRLRVKILLKFKYENIV